MAGRAKARKGREGLSWAECFDLVQRVGSGLVDVMIRQCEH